MISVLFNSPFFDVSSPLKSPLWGLTSYKNFSRLSVEKWITVIPKPLHSLRFAGEVKMSAINPTKSGINAAIALWLGVTSLAATLPSPATAQPYPSKFSQSTAQSIPKYSNPVIPEGTLIPVTLDKSDKILIPKTESRSLTLFVATNIRDRAGNILIPMGSQIVGQLQPKGRGTQFVARQLILGNNSWRSLNATSDVIATTETVNEGATTADIVKGTIAGAGTATILAGTTGDRHINALEVLGGAAFGALAGWILPTSGVLGGNTQQMIAIQPSRDLTLTLQSAFILDEDIPQLNRSAVPAPRLRPLTSNRAKPYSSSKLGL
jgi:hypothetical protein